MIAAPLMRVETWLAGGMLAVTLAISIVFQLAFNLPSSNRAAFVGVHYLIPLIGAAAWAFVSLRPGVREHRLDLLGALPAYCVILLCHFNLKLWIPHLNPALHDEWLWQTDLMVAPLVAGAMHLRSGLAPLIPLDSNFYMGGFILMFYLGFGYCCVKLPQKFRELALAAMLLQVLGSITYLAFPALGPFIYQSGVEGPAREAQAAMLAVWRQNVGDPGWLVRDGGQHLTAGLAAMPSLHAGGSALFVIFAWQRARIILPLMLPLFCFITIDAVANRWHYLIDLPIGVALAALAFAIAGRMLSRSRKIAVPRSVLRPELDANHA